MAQELVNAGEEVLIFYNDKASFNHFLEMMRSERNRMDDSSPLCYHIELVRYPTYPGSVFLGSGSAFNFAA